ncbi:hypothetical protein ACP46_gp41 [Rhizobium phage RHEph06]|uniref:Uncharacterized protein n=4 Tax=Kleczkowskavirus RHEph4 TaxID=1921526 RepID=A0A7S5UR82_9CAUD|nr:hypothetical protein ACP46_gp41 [Rhizobium phage RHEph06]YP_009598482.1 hypothetical protein FDH25_gp40 [Rhizobium phage RHEph04]AGC35802.1 hypothetical protein RHEph05_gp035 [Rhizobium phage RHEph05]QIG67665.1 hypothetical protein EVB51_048 [Rhizobium phage RHph_Y17]QIG68984.1 hypothetical protein EVB73_048 [Rhizobium phage RHph_Y3_43]QXV74919.1 hypothetical protein [Rhizobium phage RHEph26]AGC35726.1 hypothetical protein RHEph04_gp040 [Rhizobium phage RHEph04]
MTAVWAFLGGLAGIARMIAAAAITAVALILYFTWAVIPEREEKAREGYVLLTRATTAEATAQALRDQLKAQSIVIDAYQTQYRNQLAKQEQTDAEAEARITEYEAQPKPDSADDSLTIDQYDFIVRQRQSRKAASSGR